MAGNIKHIREEYGKGTLSKDSLGDSPFVEMYKWIREAIAKDCEEPLAMTLSTVSAEGRPSARVVLLRDLGLEDRLCFFTNYDSRKGLDLRTNTYASLNFFWPKLQRQLRVEGRVERLNNEQNQLYFSSRPKESQWAAVVSPQSKQIPNRAWLDEQYQQESVKNEDISCPPNWGGYALVPDAIEFWQGGAHRLHDRIKYKLTSKVWLKSRIAP